MQLEKLLMNFESFYNSYWFYVITLIIAITMTLRSYMGGPRFLSDERIDGKCVIITGASSGIGRETAIELAKRGGRIILAVKNIEAGEDVAKRIRRIPGGIAEVRRLDLSSLNDVYNFAKSIDHLGKIDILINNAGIVFHPFQKTDEGFEMHFVTNYLGHFLLTHLLLSKLKASKQGRILNVAAQVHPQSRIDFDDLNSETDFSATKCFGQSKLALVLMARHMSKLLQDTKVTINAIDPGLVRDTEHLRHSPISSTRLLKFFVKSWMWLLLKSPVQGAQTSICAAVSSKLSRESGKYLRDCEVVLLPDAVDDKTAERLFEKSIKLLVPYLLLRK